MGERTTAPELRLAEIVIDVEQVRRYASNATSAATRLHDEAVALAGGSRAVPGFWRSVPSSARATGRLDAVADLLRSHQLRCAALSTGLTAFAAAAGTAQTAVAEANRQIDEYNRQLAGNPPVAPCRPTGVIDSARTAVTHLVAADRRCVAALQAFTSGEGRGASAVNRRLHDSDAAAAADPRALAAAIRSAAGRHPPDLVAVEEQLRALGRMSAQDPRGAARVVDALGPLLATLPALGAGRPGWDGTELLGVVAAARRAHRSVAARRPGSTSPGSTSPGRTGDGPEPPATAGPTDRTDPSTTAPTTPSEPTHFDPSSGRTAADDSALPRALQHVLSAARSDLGRPYESGAAGPAAFDCSGLTRQAWAAAGVQLPHDAAAQYGVGHHVALRALQPGDLVFWATDPTQPRSIHHVALYIGHGRILEAATPGTTVYLRTLDRHEPGLLPWASRPADFAWQLNPGAPTAATLTPSGR